MRVLVAGAGALGSILGGHLAEAGAEVTLLARPAHAEAVARDGLQIGGVRGERTVRGLRAVAEAGEVGAADCLILAAKSYDTVPLLEALAPLRGQVGAVLSVQNGGGKDQALAAAFGPEAVVGAATMVGGIMPGPGRVLHTGEGATWIGELDGTASHRTAALADLFRRADLPIEVSPDIRAVTWCKLHQFVPAATLACLTRLCLHEIYLEPALAALFVALSRELAPLAERQGIPLGDYPGFGVRTVCAGPVDQAVESVRVRGARMWERGMTGVRISMLQDLARGRRTEAAETLGYALDLGRQEGVPLPLLEGFTQVIRGVEAAQLGEGASRDGEAGRA